MKTLQTLLIVASMGAVVTPTQAGETLTPAGDAAKPMTMGGCLSLCKDAICLRDCIAHVEGPLGPRAVPQRPLKDCLSEGLSHITTCATVILLRADNMKFDVDSAFWTCVSVASEVFDQCPSDGPDISLDVETRLRRTYLGHLADAAEDDYDLFLAGRLATKYPTVNVSADAGDGTPRQEQREAEPKKTFAECAAEWTANRNTCVVECGADVGCLTDCQGVAKEVFRQCVGLKPTPTG